MRLVTVEDLKEGDILANDVLLEDYTVVLGKGTVIKEPYIDKLREIGIFTVYIEEDNPIPETEPDVQVKQPQKQSEPPVAPKATPDVRTKQLEPSKAEPDMRAKQPQSSKAMPDMQAKQPKTQKTELKPQLKKSEPEKQLEKKKTPKISMEKITILRDDVEEQIKNRIKDILELHVYQHTEGLQKIAETAQNIISDIIEEDEVIEKVYDVKERSADIYEHSLQVCTIATLIALKLGMAEKQVYDISVSSLIHDLGLRYLVVRYEDQDINLLPARDQEEYKKHPIYGYTAIKNETWLSENAKEIVLNHHERKNKSGYPLGTDLITRMTQIVGVCDEFDELICGVGKARVRVHEAINNIRNYSGIWFDSDIVDAFLQLIAVYPAGSRVKTNQGEIGIVMRQNAHFPERPIIRIVKDKYGQDIRTEKIIDLIKETTVVIQEVVK